MRERELHLPCTHDYVDATRATPAEAKTIMHARDEIMSDVEAHILRSSNSVNRPMSQGSNRGNNSNSKTRRKREFKSGNAENNNVLLPASFNDNKARKSDPPKTARVVRITKPATNAVAQGPLTHKRNTRDQVQGVKERDAKKKIWSR